MSPGDLLRTLSPGVVGGLRTLRLEALPLTDELLLSAFRPTYLPVTQAPRLPGSSSHNSLCVCP